MQNIMNCPYCGGEAELTRDEYGRYSIFCTEIDCGAVMAGHKDKMLVIQMWNRRNGEPLIIETEEKKEEITPIKDLPSAKSHSNICTIRETVVRLKEDGYYVCESAIRTWTKTGQIPYFNVGRRILISYSTVMNFLRSGDNQKPAAQAIKEIR